MWSVVMWSELTLFMWSDFVLKWSEVKCSDVNWCDLCEVILFWSELSYGEVLGHKSTMYFRVTFYWGYLTVLWLFHLGVSCTVVVSTCFVMCGLVYVGMFWQVCGCSGNMCTCIYCVLYCLYCVFVLFRLCIFILICFICTSVRTTATEWKLNCLKK